MKLRPLIISLVVICLLAASAWWVSQRITVSYEDKRKQPEKDIRLNPMSALEQLLKHFDIEVRNHNNRNLLHDLPPTDEAIVIQSLKQPLTEEREAALLNWVAQGGQLVYEPSWLGASDTRQYFHERLGIQIQEAQNWLDIPYPHHAWAKMNNEYLYFHIDREYILSLDSNSQYKEDSHVIIESDSGAHAIQVNHGQGSVLFLSDSYFLTTPRVWQSFYSDEYEEECTGLACHDHAYFMWQLLKDNKKVSLIYESTSPALMTNVYKHFPSLVIFSSIWLVLFLLFLLKRFGPVISQLSGEHRNLQQHIQHAGNYHWQQDQGNYLLNAWRIRIQHKIFVKHPNIAGLQNHALYDALANLSGYTPLEIQQAWIEPCRNQSEFTSYTQRLKKLWIM